MAFIQADLEAIERAIATGAQSVQFADRLVSYRSVDALLKARAAILAALNPVARTSLGVANKGLDG